MSAPRELRIRVGTVRVVGGSTIQARRIADDLPAALERALAGQVPTATRPADRVAAAIAEQVRRDVRSDSGVEVGQ